MKHLALEFKNLQRLVKMLAAQLGKNTEIALHDYVNHSHQHSIVAIENGYITGRTIGDGGPDVNYEVKQSHTDPTTGDVYNYFTKTKDGTVLRSSALYFRNENNTIVGALCINTDISDYVALQKSLGALTLQDNGLEIHQVFASSVTELTDQYLLEASQLIDTPVETMTREEKVTIIEYLDRKGFFLITRSGDMACDFLDISKYTLYKYLGEIRDATDAPE